MAKVKKINILVIHLVDLKTRPVIVVPSLVPTTQVDRENQIHLVKAPWKAR
jgi:hypothetical protein